MEKVLANMQGNNHSTIEDLRNFKINANRRRDKADVEEVL